MNNIIALDLSSHSTGYCVANEQGDILEYGCIQSSSSNIFKRIQIMADKICELIQKHEIGKIVAEEVIPNYNDRTYKVLTWLQGIIFYSAYLINPKVEQEVLVASTWRSRIGIHTGRGIKRHQLKQADIEYVLNKYGISANDDVCDAICLKDAYFKDKIIDNRKQPTSDSDFLSWT